jgi:hypothetical protein
MSQKIIECWGLNKRIHKCRPDECKGGLRFVDARQHIHGSRRGLT